MWRFRFLSVALVVLSTVHNTSQRSTVASPDYVAAVVEYNPASGASDVEIYNNNVANYVEIIENATQQTVSADIIVFAEAGLATLGRRVFTEVPDSAAGIVPCTDESDVYVNLRQISCAARDNAVYVVINLSERFPCPAGSTSEYGESCPPEEFFNYNTNVVFDRNGTVIARYRKYNLFGEEGMVSPPRADLETFDTDFGVKFGLFTCFDLMFDKPAIQLVKQENITDLIFPTAWFSELPFLTAVQAQAGFAHSMDVNFLASGYNEPAGGSGGSGIFAGRTGWSYVMPAEAQTQLLISRVAKKNFKSLSGSQQLNPIQSKITTLKTTRGKSGMYMKLDDLSAFKSVLIVNDETNERVCHQDFCCEFDVVADLSSGTKYFYRMFAFDGVRTFSGVTTGGVQICAVVFCTDAEQASCGKTLDDAEQGVATTFTSIRIKSSRFHETSAVQYPNTLVPEYQILSPEDFAFRQEALDGRMSCEMELVKKTQLLTFGIFGREFTRDGQEVTGSGGSTVIVASITLLVFSIALGYIQTHN